MKSYKKYYLTRIIVTTVFGVLLGLLFFAARPYAEEVFDVLLIAMGLMTVAMNLPPFLFSLFHIKRKGEWISLLITAVAIAFGVLVTLLQREVLLLIVGIYSVVLPIVRTFLVAERRQHIKRELPVICFGLFMVLVSLGEIEETVFLVGGIAILALSGIYLLWGLLTMKPRFEAYEEYLQTEALIEIPLETDPPEQQE